MLPVFIQSILTDYNFIIKAPLPNRSGAFQLATINM